MMYLKLIFLIKSFQIIIEPIGCLIKSLSFLPSVRETSKKGGVHLKYMNMKYYTEREQSMKNTFEIIP